MDWHKNGYVYEIILIIRLEWPTSSEANMEG